MQPMSPVEVRSCQLEVLDHFVRTCRENGLEYQLACGTLLGAVRHSGYIPWDDDIDVMMIREDYERFLKIHGTESAGFRCSAPAIDAIWPLGFAKVWSRKTLVLEDSNLGLRAGVGIDVWPVDAVARGGPQRRLAFLLHHVLRSIEVLLAVRRRADHTILQQLALRCSKPILRCLGAARIAKWRDSLATHPWMGSGFSGIFVGSRLWAVPSEHFRNSTEQIFEGRKLPVPHQWPSILGVMYGDYMKLPPTSQQVSHHRAAAFWIPEEG